ncbi:hypothetical protein CFAM422_004718 [Trichoderma lentiforme]|uniref:Uncharacterized protein n=1 Tax=Trichoderma lentiforme TaxID=1567552 RepID=A0A9P4XIB9_9HYPO|nr:hypothetical protein CFAM422_004718 [Trichoderma lentiforme]
MAPVPSPEVRANIAAKIDALILAVEKNPDFKRASSNGGLYHVWDFAHRTQYMLFEVDGIRQEGYEFKHAGQIKITKRGEEAAEELYTDTFTRSVTLDQLISGPPLMRNMMGMSGEITPEIQAASKAVIDAFPGF